MNLKELREILGPIQYQESFCIPGPPGKSSSRPVLLVNGLTPSQLREICELALQKLRDDEQQFSYSEI